MIVDPDMGADSSERAVSPCDVGPVEDNLVVSSAAEAERRADDNTGSFWSTVLQDEPARRIIPAQTDWRREFTDHGRLSGIVVGLRSRRPRSTAWSTRPCSCERDAVASAPSGSSVDR